MASRSASRYLLGVFGSWPALAAGVAALGKLFEVDGRFAVMALAGTFQEQGSANFLKAASPALHKSLSERRHLQLAAEPSAVDCTSGSLADRLEQRSRDGCSSFADALAMWMLPQQARELADDIRRGRILLWVRLFASDPEREIGETLFTNGPLRVEVHDLVPAVKVCE